MPFVFTIPAPPRRPEEPATITSATLSSGVNEESVPAEPDGLEISVENGQSLIVVGANGSGKTRFSTWLENYFGESAHRISAHRTLSLKPGVPKISEADALSGLRFGTVGNNISIIHRPGNRWNEDGATSLLNDFDYLVQALFAEQSRTALSTHNKARAGDHSAAKATKFEILQEIWEQLLPHRKLVISGDDIQACRPGDELVYSGAGMSDGERAIFYLLGQSLMANSQSLLIIDEPELHLHRSIMSKLWDMIENARPDCAFAFITHDLEFAASRVGKKIIISDYAHTGPSWKSELVPDNTGFSEELTTLILGSRRPILFVEGDLKSLDRAVYRCIYPEWTVISRGSCKDVLHAVSTMRANATLTRIRCAGIVDADDFEPNEISALNESSVHILPVSEIENLFLLPDVSREIGRSDHMSESEIDMRLSQLYDKIFEKYKKTEFIEPVVHRYCLRRIDRTLKIIDLSNSKTIDEMSESYANKVKSLSVHRIAEIRRSDINEAVKNRNIARFLALVDDKGMLSISSSKLRNTTQAIFESWLTRVLLNDRSPDLVRAIKENLPKIT